MDQMIERKECKRPRCSCSRMHVHAIDELFVDENGSTTLGMVIALLVSLALIFTSMQVYSVNSQAAEIQDVADAAALSAENQVGEFMIAVELCDALVLSLSLLGLSTTGLGLVALCIPPTAGLAKSLIEAGQRILRMRDAFAERAARALNELQSALPYIAAVCAAHTAAANGSSTTNALYAGVAILVRSEGAPIEITRAPHEKNLADQVDSRFDDLRAKAEEADKAARKAHEAKLRAYEHDCGADPSYCMYERAEHLAGLVGASNPFFGSADTWSFSYALERARSYYHARLRNEAPESDSVDACSRSALRKVFYEYACEQMTYAYVHETADSFEAYFPHLPRNTSDMRKTHLYTDNIFPITQDDQGIRIMHAWSGCPQVSTIAAWGSLSLMEAEDMPSCSSCSFTAASLGKVAAASTSIENGFEYHYEIVASEAEKYEKAYEDLREPKQRVQNEVGGFLDRIAELMKSSFGKRITASPPGRYGAISFVVNGGSFSPSTMFPSSFVNTNGTLGPRVAISAATLIGEDSAEGKTVINSLLDGFASQGGAAVGAAGVVLNAWSFLLRAYTEGHDAILSGIRNSLDSIPVIGPSGLGTWASKTLSSCIESLGLQPAELRAFKAVLVNSEYVAQYGDDAFSQNFVTIKRRIVAASIGATDIFSLLLNDAQAQALQEVDSWGDSLEIASIELLGPGGVSIPVAIPLPRSLKASSRSFIQGIFAQLRALHARTNESKVWQ